MTPLHLTKYVTYVSHDCIEANKYSSFHLLSEQQIDKMRTSEFRVECLKHFFRPDDNSKFNVGLNDPEGSFLNNSLDDYLRKEFGANLKDNKNEIIRKLDIKYDNNKEEGILDLNIDWKFVFSINSGLLTIPEKYSAALRFYRCSGDNEYHFVMIRAKAERRFFEENWTKKLQQDL